MGPYVVKTVLLFPLLFPSFQRGPLTETLLFPGPYRVVYPEEAIALQHDALALGDRDVRLQALRELRRTGMASAFDMLADQLGKESDPKMIASVLAELERSSRQRPGMAKQVLPFLQHDSADVRFWAVSLYGRLEGCRTRTLLEVLKTDSSQAVREIAAERLRDMPDRISLDTYRRFWKDDNSRVQAAMVRGALARPDCGHAAKELLQRAGEAPIPVRFVLADTLPRQPRTLATALIPVLCRDESAAVRASVARSLGELGDENFLSRLLTLCRDQGSEVRRSAVVSCVRFPGPAVRAAFIERLADSSTLVRRAAEDGLVSLHGTCSVSAAVAAHLHDSTACVRYHVYRVIGRLDLREYAGPIHELLRRETTAANLAAASFALGCLDAKAAAPTIARLAKHPDADVRRCVAEALGKLGVPSTYGALKHLAFDPVPEVGHAAIMGMGNLGDGKAFNQTIRQVLLIVEGTKMTPANRCAAAWAASRLRPMDRALLERLKVQATVPVIPMGMGMMVFEDDYVLATLAFSLATCARENAFAKQCFETVYADLSHVFGPGEMPPHGKISPSPEVVEAARQALAFYKGEVPQPKLRPTTTGTFSYSRAEREQEN